MEINMTTFDFPDDEHGEFGEQDFNDEETQQLDFYYFQYKEARDLYKKLIELETEWFEPSRAAILQELLDNLDEDNK